MALLYYWRGDNYRRDLDFGAAYHLNQSNPVLHEIALGDSLWAFTRRLDGAYVLAAELVAKAKTFNPTGYRYGRFRLWGDLHLSRYFATGEQGDISTLIRGLSISAKADALGRAFQGHAAVRRLDERDDRFIRAYAENLRTESRARLLPEERLEWLLHTGDAAAVSRLVAEEPSGLARDRMEYLTSEAPRRNPAFADELRDIYSGRCQICAWQPRSVYGVDLCEAHHLRWLGRGGQDSLTNLVLLCPNHHRVVHRVDAPFDWSAMGFLFGSRVEKLDDLQHGLVAC